MARRVTLRDAQKSFTHDRLIAAALEVFERDGYAGTTVESIAAAAGASRATFYLHFTGKAAVVGEVLAGPLYEDAVDVYKPLGSQGMLLPSQLRGFIAQVLGYWDRHRVLLDILNQAEAVEPDEVRRGPVLSEVVDLLAAYFVRVSGRSVEDARILAVLFVGQLDRYYYFSNLPGVDFDRERAISALTELWSVPFCGRWVAGTAVTDNADERSGAAVDDRGQVRILDLRDSPS